MRRALTWLVVLPVVVVCSQIAHGLAYWWAYPQANLRLAILATSGHGYLSYSAPVFAALGAIELLVLAVALVSELRGGRLRGLPPSVFLVLPMLMFTLQEHIERLVGSGVFPWWTVEQPSFWRGLVLQIPLGLAAYVVASFLLRTVSTVARVAAAPREQLVVFAAPVTAPPLLARVPRVAPLAGAAAGRAPPR